MLPVAAPATQAAAAAELTRPYVSARSHTPEALLEALDAHQGNQTRAAQALGLTLRQFSYRLRKAGLR